MKLLIYIPAFNAAPRIDRTLKHIFMAIDNLSEPDRNNVIVHINDNASSDSTLQHCLEFSQRRNFHIQTNSSNIGLTGNFVIGMKIDYGQTFTWIIGDDDIVAPSSLVRLFHYVKALGTNNVDLDFFLLNVGLWHSDLFFGADFFDRVRSGSLNATYLLNRRHAKPAVCKFPAIIDPEIEGSIPGAIAMAVFKADKVRRAVSDIDFNYEPDLSKGMMCGIRPFPQLYVFAEAFSLESLVLIDPEIYVYGTYGHQTWIPERNRIFSIGALDILMHFYETKVLSCEHLLYAVNGLVKKYRPEFSQVMSSSEFSGMPKRHMETLLKAMFLEEREPLLFREFETELLRECELPW